MNRFVKSINRVSLIQQIIIGLIIGILTALYVPDVANELALLGVLFVGALKGIAPILVFFLVIAAISKHRSGQKTGMGYVEALYNYNISIAALEQLTGVPLSTPVGQGAEVIANSGAVEQLSKLGGNQ